ncbi:hypothetical protein K438DRAFT_1985221 [Mycena galopus ATCC 62051]|nr:hypothetical protein K438DRAFT_1985221 [Mycena galopus ATCC 62051]
MPEQKVVSSMKRTTQEQSTRLPETVEQSKQTAEMVAILEAASGADEDANIAIECNSKHIINTVTKYRQRREDQGYIGVANRNVERAMVAALRQRKRKTKVKRAEGRNDHGRGNGAKVKADEGAKKNAADEIDLSVPPTLNVTGAKLSAMTQSLAYKAIRERKMKAKLKKRERTKANIERAKAEAEDNFGFQPTEAKIWKSIQSKDLSRQTRYFLWMTTHDAYIVGSHWLRDTNSPEKQERAECGHCGTIESMEHILSQCEIPGQAEIWKLAKGLWTKRNPKWAWPGIGTIISSGLAVFKDEKGKVNSGDARLYRILMSESAYLIWKLRCERLMQNNGTHPTTMEIHNRWITTMNARLQLDCNMTERKYEKKAIPPKTVLKTWKGLLKDEDMLPDDWTGSAGVLVGMEPRRQQGG